MKALKLVAKGGLFSLAGDAINYSLSYVFLLLASHLLGAGNLGAYYWVFAIASLLGEFADCGTGQGLIYYGPRFEAEKGMNKSLPLFRFVLRFTLTNAVILGCLLFLFAPQITAYFNKPELIGLLRLCSVALPLGLFWPVLYKYCVARFKIVEGIIYGDIVRPILRVTILLLFILIGTKAIALVGTELLVGLLMIVLGLLVIRRLWGKVLFSGDLTGGEKRSLLFYSLPFLPLNLARGERAILILTGFFLAVTQVGIFGVVLKLAAISQVILTGLNFVFRPMVAKLYVERDMTTLNSLYKAITRWIFILTLPFSYLFIFYPGAVLGLFGEKFAAGSVALVIVAVGYLFEYGTSATQVIINMTGKSWWSLLNQLAYLAVIAGLGVWLIPGYGIIGAAIAVASAIVVVNLLRLYQSYRIVGFTPYSFYLLKPICAAAISGLVWQFVFPLGGALPWMKLAVLAAGYVTLYASLVLLMKLDQGEKELLSAARRKFGRT
ncbi:MAG: polysaccharide biosynthesis C-terminal domain-containing protein [Candidatus Margulisiibacteriota bacterium]